MTHTFAMIMTLLRSAFKKICNKFRRLSFVTNITLMFIKRWACLTQWTLVQSDRLATSRFLRFNVKLNWRYFVSNLIHLAWDETWQLASFASLHAIVARFATSCLTYWLIYSFVALQLSLLSILARESPPAFTSAILRSLWMRDVYVNN